MATAELVGELLPQFCPTTNHYKCSDGTYLLVTVPSLDSVGTLTATLGITVPVAVSQLPVRADIFLSDEDATVLDADGDPANGLTPLATLDGITDHKEALSLLGYELAE